MKPFTKSLCLVGAAVAVPVFISYLSQKAKNEVFGKAKEPMNM